MKRTKSEKAITLVALIITIIVLLILAVVAIRAVTGDGIIAHAKNARTQYEEKAAEENALLSNLTDYITGHVGNNNGEDNKDDNPVQAEVIMNKLNGTTIEASLDVDCYFQKLVHQYFFRDNKTISKIELVSQFSPKDVSDKIYNWPSDEAEDHAGIFDSRADALGVDFFNDGKICVSSGRTEVGIGRIQ